MNNTANNNDYKTNDIFDKEVSLFDHATATINPKHIMIKDLLSGIESGIYKNEVNQARHLLATKGKKDYDSFKKKYIPGFTLSVNCNHRKSDSNANGDINDKLISKTGLLQIDIDNISIDELDSLRIKLNNDKYTLFSFLSLSGKGIKIGIRIDEDKHSESFIQAEKYYKETYNLSIDKSVKDIFRLCFISYDPNVYRNPNANIFITKNDKIEKEVSAKLQKPKTNYVLPIDSNRASSYGQRAIQNAVNSINNSINGNRNNIRCKAGYLIGGYISGGLLDENYALHQLEMAVKNNTDLPIAQAMVSIKNAIKKGKLEPITFEKLEKERNEFISKGHNIYPIDTDLNQIKNTEKSPKLPFCFWYEIKDKNNNYDLKIQYTELYGYLKTKGIRKIIFEDNGTKRLLVRIINNVVEEIDIDYIQNMLLNSAINELPEIITAHKTRYDLKELLLKGINVYINDPKLNDLPFIKIEFLQDIKDSAYFFFKNGFIEANANGLQLKDYSQLNGYIWKSQIINHNFKVINDQSLITDFSFSTFTRNICSSRVPNLTFDGARYQSLVTTIGYLLHNYKNSSNKFAVIFSESNLTDEPQGRTGKGLIMQAIGKLRKLTIIDGRNFTFESAFAFQNVSRDTQLILFDDISKNFSFPKLFSVITEGLSYERKHKDRINLSPKDSPKVCISTNYSLNGNSESEKGRKFDMELLCYYNANYKPIDDFKKSFFDEWDIEEWNLFYNFMMMCIRSYFSNNNSIFGYTSDTLNERKLLNSTSPEFVDYADSLPRRSNLVIGDIYNNFIEIYGIDTNKMTKITFSKWLKIYCSFRGINCKVNFINSNGKTIRHYYLE